MRPSRPISSDAPEVVPDSRHQSPDKYYIPPSFGVPDIPATGFHHRGLERLGESGEWGDLPQQHQSFERLARPAPLSYQQSLERLGRSGPRSDHASSQSQGSSSIFQQLKVDDHESAHPGQHIFPPHPAFKPVYSPPSRAMTGYDPVPYGIKTSNGPRRRIGLCTTIILAAVAFILGGGIGGGVGGAIAANEKSKVTKSVLFSTI
jgi:hypothetical protein